MALFSKGMYAIVGNTTLTKPFFFNEKNSVLEKRYILTALKTTLITSFYTTLKASFVGNFSEVEAGKKKS